MQCRSKSVRSRPFRPPQLARSVTLNRSAFSQHKSASHIASFARGLLLEFELVVNPPFSHQRFIKRSSAAAVMKSNRLSLGIVPSMAFMTPQRVSFPSPRLASTDAPCIPKLSARRRCYRIAFAGAVVLVKCSNKSCCSDAMLPSLPRPVVHLIKPSGPQLGQANNRHFNHCLASSDVAAAGAARFIPRSTFLTSQARQPLI